ncbi:hypothetical protein CYMTET_29132 [Cymbomonas tetramitiformis]|uniref:Uncharacterized protein n=1 Tax=Cymbomonas tetramitiformis TaxID=36881 RepID=A0AAE0KV83_9CHLO|nr:hypothetical protein CYMTET_29132 [Cymbomonas tetramitiformis]
MEKVDALKRAQLISLCHTQARTIAHYRSTLQISTQPVITLEPIVFEDIRQAVLGSDSEDESEYPPGYYDDSDNDYGEDGGHLAFPEFSPSQEQALCARGKS